MLKPIWRSPEEIRFGREEHGSTALPYLLEEAVLRQRVKALDLGAANGPNVEFLAKYCRSVYIEDLFQNVPHESYEALPYHAPPSLSVNVRPFAEGHRFDLVLCWDLLNYLSPAAITEVSRQVRQVCAEGALLFALVWRRRQIFTRPGKYQLSGEDRIVYEPTSPALRPSSSVTKAELSRLLVGFERHHCYRLRNGMDEEIFVAA